MADPHAAIEIGRLPVVEEVLRVGKRRRVTGRVRVSVGTEEVPEAVQASRRSRLVEIDRVKVDREVEEPPPVRQEGDTVIVPVLEERLVLVRRLVVVEEVRFRLRMEEEPVTLTAPRLRQSVVVERLPVLGDDDDDSTAIEWITEEGGPSAMQRTITAMFDTRAEADRAAEALRALGIGASDVRIRLAEGTETMTTTTDRREDRGILAAIADLFVPDEDRATYHEGLRRGAVLVSATVEESRLQTAMDALEAAGAVDLDARENTWREEGWRGTAVMGAHGEKDAITTSTTTGQTVLSGGANPPGTMVSRGIDQVAGTNISGAHPENETVRTDYSATAATSGTAYAATGDYANRADLTDEERIRLAEERIRVGKREAHAGRVRVRSYVVETPVEEQVRLREERVHVERVATDAPVTGNAEELFREKVIEARESVEEAVVQKDVRITGEVVVNKDVTERVETIRDTVRRTEVEVEDETKLANDPTRRPGRGAA